MLKKILKVVGYSFLLLFVVAASILAFGPFFNHIGQKAAISSKILCSAKFVSGRNIEEAMANSLQSLFPTDKVKINGNRVSFTSLGITRSSIYVEGCGCIALPAGTETLNFEPEQINSAPVNIKIPRKIDQALQSAIERNFSITGNHTAVLVIQDSAIIAEHYAPGFDAKTKFESWSMGKSLTATLIGRLIQEGRLSLRQKAPIKEWANDSRSEITIANLLNMSSGLEFSRESGLINLLFKPISHHGAVYGGMSDVFSYSINAPLEHPPNTVGRYRNCDPLALGAIFRRNVEANGEPYTQWPQKHLFDKLGTNEFLLERDLEENFILTGFDYGTANAWARLGMLYLQNGQWNGEQLIPASFVDFVKTPAPAWENGEYGGQFWVGPNVTEQGFPDDAYCMLGLGGQRTCIIPSYNAVVVRFGHTSIDYQWDTGEPYIYSTINEHLSRQK